MSETAPAKAQSIQDIAVAGKRRYSENSESSRGRRQISRDKWKQSFNIVEDDNKRSGELMAEDSHESLKELLEEGK